MDVKVKSEGGEEEQKALCKLEKDQGFPEEEHEDLQANLHGVEQNPIDEDKCPAAGGLPDHAIVHKILDEAIAKAVKASKQGKLGRASKAKPSKPKTKRRKAISERAPRPKKQEKGGKTDEPEKVKEIETDIAWIKKLVSEKTSYSCGLCYAAFDKAPDIEHHLKASHAFVLERELSKAGVRPFLDDGEPAVCRYCGKRFYDTNNLVRHALEVHNSFRSHRCQLCPDRRGFHKPEFGRDHVLKEHAYEVSKSHLDQEQFVKETVRYIPRPFSTFLAITPAPRHLYAVVE